jgi:hypothetical protein
MIKSYSFFTTTTPYRHLQTTLCLLLLLIPATLLQSQNQPLSLGAFDIFNGRNRPELQWKEVETDLAKIVYHDDLYEIALLCAAIADSTVIALSQVFDFTPQKKVLIYISNQDNITNGAALLSQYIFLYVDVNDFPKIFTGNQKWLQKVIPHEIVHWFVFYALRDWMSNMIPLSELSFPANLHEGYAQFFSGEPWGLNRGDRYLRTFSFTEATDDMSGRWYGGYMYANGFALVKYLAEFYGEEKLIQLLKRRQNRLSLYNFEKSFSDVYGKPFSQMVDEWTSYIRAYYYGEHYLQKVFSSDRHSIDATINAITPLKSNFEIQDIVIKNDRFVASARISKNQRFQTLVAGTYVPDSLSVDAFHIKEHRIIATAPWFRNFDFSPDGSFVVYSRLTRHRHGRLAPSITLIDNRTNKTKNIGEGAFPVVTNDGSIYFQKNDLHGNYVMRYTPQTPVEVFYRLSSESQIGEIRLNHSGNLLAVSIFDSHRDFFVAILDSQSGYLIHTIPLQNMPQQMLWIDDEHLSVSVESSANFLIENIIYHYLQETERHYQPPPFNVFPKAFFEIDSGYEILSLNEMTRSHPVLGKVSLIEKTHMPEMPVDLTQNYYTRWLHAVPSIQIPDVITPYSDLIEKRYTPLANVRYRMGLVLPFFDELFAMAIFSEPLGKHNMIFAFSSTYDFAKKPFWYISYINSTQKPTITFTTLHTNWIAGFSEDDMVANNIVINELVATLPIDIWDRPFSLLNFSLGLSHYDYSLLESSADFEDRYDQENIILGKANITYLYNLPWKNSAFHPVRKLFIDTSYEFSHKSLGMSRTYDQYKLYSDMSYAPFINKTNSEFIKTISLQNKSLFRTVGSSADALRQHLPGVDDAEYITLSGQSMFSRLYLRGFEETMWGRQIVSTQSDLRFKLTDDINYSINWGIPLLSAHYLGFSLWYDYAQLSQILFLEEQAPRYKVYQAMGYEIQTMWNILGLPTVHKFGEAFTNKGKRISSFYMMDIPLILF